MVESIHQIAGTYRYGYNHANQRVFQYTDTTAFGTLKRRFSLYGFAGELLLEANRTGTGVQPHTGEVVRYVYFLGRKMFASVNRGPLKAAVPNRLGSRSEHFPYGELKGAAPPEGDKDHFTTYRRDETGLDYAWNRYYAPSVGRFTTADPYDGSAVAAVPATWNRYSYVSNNPVSYTDPKGLFLETYGGPGSIWIICAVDPFAAMSTNAGACSNSPHSEEMWSILGPAPFQPIDPIEEEMQSRRAYTPVLSEQLLQAASAARSRSQQSRGPRPTFLRVKRDCWLPSYDLSANYTRIVTYEILGQDGRVINYSNLKSAMVMEKFLDEKGTLNLRNQQGTWSVADGSIESNSTIRDILSAGGLISGVSNVGSAYQVFYVMEALSFFSRDFLAMIPRPLMILGFGNPTVVLYNEYFAKGVIINGVNIGMDPSRKCN
jgi:RHS repeat-associated protein